MMKYNKWVLDFVEGFDPVAIRGELLDYSDGWCYAIINDKGDYINMVVVHPNFVNIIFHNKKELLTDSEDKQELYQQIYNCLLDKLVLKGAFIDARPIEDRGYDSLDKDVAEVVTFLEDKVVKGIDSYHCKFEHKIYTNVSLAFISSPSVEAKLRLIDPMYSSDPYEISASSDHPVGELFNIETNNLFNLEVSNALRHSLETGEEVMSFIDTQKLRNILESYSDEVT